MNATLITNQIWEALRFRNDQTIRECLAILTRENVAEAHYPELREAAKAARRYMTRMQKKL